MSSVSFSGGGLPDRDIIFRDETDLVICFLGCVWLCFRHAKLTAGGEGRLRILAIECVSFSLFFALPTVLAFFFLRSSVHTHINNEGARHSERPKGEREQFASLDFWITD